MAKGDKGGLAEERLREFFLSTGAYVVRGAKMRYGDQDVTDVDLLLYSKVSNIGRERACVDVKFKTVPKALERILWAKGLQALLRTDRAFVATPDTRPVVKAFAARHGVTLVDGRFLDALFSAPRSGPSRISEETLYAQVGIAAGGKLSGDWRTKLDAAKSCLVAQLNFDGANALLSIFQTFVEMAIALRADGPLRAAYLVASQFLLVVDFLVCGLAFSEPSTRLKSLTEGFRYGTSGAARSEEVARRTADLLDVYAPGARGKLRKDMADSWNAVPAEILAEFFGRSGIANDAFGLALALEACVYAQTVQYPDELPAPLKAVLGVLLDFHHIDRPMFFSLQRVAHAHPPTVGALKQPAATAPSTTAGGGSAALRPDDGRDSQAALDLGEPTKGAGHGNTG